MTMITIYYGCLKLKLAGIHPDEVGRTNFDIHTLWVYICSVPTMDLRERCTHVFTCMENSVRLSLFRFFFLVPFLFSVRCSSIRCELVCSGCVCAKVWVMVWVRDSTENRLFKFNARRKQRGRRAGWNGSVFNFGIRVNWKSSDQ